MIILNGVLNIELLKTFIIESDKTVGCENFSNDLYMELLEEYFKNKNYFLFRLEELYDISGESEELTNAYNALCKAIFEQYK